MTTSATHATFLSCCTKSGSRPNKWVSLLWERVGVEPDGFWLPECAYSPEMKIPSPKQERDTLYWRTHGVLCAYPDYL